MFERGGDVKYDFGCDLECHLVCDLECNLRYGIGHDLVIDLGSVSLRFL